jgi:RimJ/RimL family protein N-acetyltransferase
MKVQIPELRTDRLVLRAPQPGDFEAALAMWTHADVVRFIGKRAQTREEVWGRILRYIGHWHTLGYGFWSITLDGAFIGECGFGDFHREIDPPIAWPEMGWSLAPAAHGKGFAAEALRAVVAWGDENLNTPRTACIIDPANIPSLRVAAKIGFRETLRTTYRGDETVAFERNRGAA